MTHYDREAGEGQDKNWNGTNIARKLLTKTSPCMVPYNTKALFLEWNIQWLEKVAPETVKDCGPFINHLQVCTFCTLFHSQ